jgi:hypothetical protein
MLPRMAHFCKNVELSHVSSGGWKQTFDIRLMRQRLYQYAAPARLIFVKTLSSPVSSVVAGNKPLMLG